MQLIEVNPLNIDDRVLRQAVSILNNGGLVAYPTDTSWSIGCSSKSKQGIEKLKKLKAGKSFVPALLCSEIAQANEYVTIETTAFRVIKRHVPGPFVFVFEPRSTIEKLVQMKRLEIGFRIPDHPLPLALCRTLGHPLFSSSANRQMANTEWWDEAYAEENLYISGHELMEIEDIDLILDSGEDLPKLLSTVVSMKSESPWIIRQGVGLLS